MRHAATRTHPKGNAHPETRATIAKRTSRPLWLLAAVFFLAAGGTWAFAEFVLWNKLPGNLVGKWVVEGGEQDGATFDFHRGGTMVGRINLKGRQGIIKASIAVDQNRLIATTQNPQTGASDARIQTILVLTPTQLVLRDERGNVLNMVRADN